MFTASACAKVILFGEHAVVYGEPAIAVPVSRVRATATAQPSKGHTGLHIIATDMAESYSIDAGQKTGAERALSLTAHLVLEKFRVPPPDVLIEVSSKIPIASGLGSGAAVSTALARVLGLVLNREFQLEMLNQLIYEVEKLHHGTPSGIDNTVIVYEQPVYFIRSQPIERIAIGTPFSLVIADSGQSALTRTAVADVRKLHESAPSTIQPLIKTIGHITIAAKDAIRLGSLRRLGELMSENHELLRQLTVSSAALDRLVTAATDAGALGAKMSGGGRGGNMIALVTSETAQQVQTALLSAGARTVLTTVVS